MYLTGSPPCAVFSTLRYLTNKKRPKEVVEKEEEEGRHHMRVSVKAYKRQMARKRFFLREWPKNCTGWKGEEMKELMENPGVVVVDGSM